MAKPMTEYERGRLRVQADALAVKATISGDKNDLAEMEYLDKLIVGNLTGEAEEQNKIHLKKIAAVADYFKQLNGGTAKQQLWAFTTLLESYVESPQEILKIGAATDPRLMADVIDAANKAMGADTATRETNKNMAAWQTFYGRASTANGAALLATYDRLVDDYGDPPQSVTGWAEGLQQNRRNIDRDLLALRTQREVAAGRAKALPELMRTDPDAAVSEFEEIKKALPGVATPEAILVFQEDLKKADPSRALHQKAEDYLLKRREEARTREEKPVEDTHTDDQLARFYSTEKAQWWAKENGFDVGRVVPYPPNATPEEKKAFEKTYPTAYFSQFGIYVPGPDDEKAADFAQKQLHERPEKRLFERVGLGNPLGRTKETIEFDVQAPDDSNAPVAQAWVHDGGVIYKLEDGRYIGTNEDGSRVEEIPEAAASKMIPTAEEIHERDVPPLPESTPKGKATRTVRGVYARPSLRDPLGSTAYYDETGRRQVVKKEDIVGKARSVSGGADRRSASEIAGSLANKGSFNKLAAEANENQEVPGPKAKPSEDRPVGEQANTTGHAAKTLDAAASRTEANVERIASQPTSTPAAQAARIARKEGKAARLRAEARGMEPQPGLRERLDRANAPSSKDSLGLPEQSPDRGPPAGEAPAYHTMQGTRGNVPETPTAVPRQKDVVKGDAYPVSLGAPKPQGESTSVPSASNTPAADALRKVRRKTPSEPPTYA